MAKRTLPVLLPLLLLVCLAAQAARAATPAPPQRPTGTWLMSVVPDPDPGAPPPFAALVTLSSDGTFVITESDEAVVTQGVWAWVAGNTLVLDGYQFLFDDPGVQRAHVHLTMHASKGARHLEGRFAADFQAADGTVLFAGGGTVAGDQLRRPE
jgi:hypothetical protein